MVLGTQTQVIRRGNSCFCLLSGPCHWPTKSFISIPQNSQKKNLGVVMGACSLNAGELETGGSLGFAHSQPSLFGKFQVGKRPTHMEMSKLNLYQFCRDTDFQISLSARWSEARSFSNIYLLLNKNLLRERAKESN